MACVLFTDSQTTSAMVSTSVLSPAWSSDEMMATSSRASRRLSLRPAPPACDYYVTTPLLCRAETSSGGAMA